MKAFLKYMFWLLAAGAFAGGLHHLVQLRGMLIPVSAYQRAEGSVVHVEPVLDRNPGHAELPGSNRWIYRVVYTYRFGQQQWQSERLSPSCDVCVSGDVERMTGKPPPALLAGTPVNVYVLRDKPQIAYLALATGAEIRAQCWVVLLWLIVAPAGVIAASRPYWKKTEQRGSHAQ